MPVRLLLPLVLAVFPLLASATQPAAPAADAAASTPKKICTKEKPVGSNRPVRVCRDAEAAERQGEQAREALQQAQTHRFNPPET